MLEIWHYLTESGEDVFQDWLDNLADPTASARIAARVNRLRAGNFGDCKPLRAGVWELRVDYGPGYRVYYALAGKEVVLLLCGGDKRTQATDIQQAVAYWKDYHRRSSP